MTADLLACSDILPEPDLPSSAALLSEGRALANDWQVGPSAFLRHVDAACEADFKRRCVSEGRIMRHAQIGFRDFDKNCRAYRAIWETCGKEGAAVDRYGMTLDWAMGYPLERRREGPRGTGMMLEGPEAFATLANQAPVAAHFGDWVLGFPGAVTNTCWALAAGSTAIGNLGQLYTFRLPDWDDDVTTVAETVKALGLIAAQPVEVLVHTNLDDGFASSFNDLGSCLGAALLDRYIVEDLIGASMTHCFGHHFSEPVPRLAFHLALADGARAPGSMIYGNTTTYRGGGARNFAGLATYLLTDILGQRARPTGHAVNPVPVTEHERIPDIDEIVAAQLFADRLIEAAPGFDNLCDVNAARNGADAIVAAGRTFRDRVLKGLGDRGYDVGCPFELFLALRRIGARRLEATFGASEPAIISPVRREIDAMAERRLDDVAAGTRDAIAGASLRALVATSDVHEHGKTLLETMCDSLGVAAVDGGVSVDPDDLAARAAECGCDLICISTYNGVALGYAAAVVDELRTRSIDVPVLIGGRLNQIPDASNTSLPVDVSSRITELGVDVCRDARDLLPILERLAGKR